MKGDYFARHFGKEVTLCIDEYQAAAVDAHIDTLLIEQEAPNMNTTKSGYCAPATVQFSAIANTPTAALFNWKIYRQGKKIIRLFVLRVRRWIIRSTNPGLLSSSWK